MPPSFHSFQSWRFLLPDGPSLSTCQCVERFINKTAKETDNISERKRGRKISNWSSAWFYTVSWAPSALLTLAIEEACTQSFSLASPRPACSSKSPGTIFSFEDQQCIPTASSSTQNPASNLQLPTSYSHLRFPYFLLEFRLTNIVFVCERKSISLSSFKTQTVIPTVYLSDSLKILVLLEMLAKFPLNLYKTGTSKFVVRTQQNTYSKEEIHQIIISTYAYLEEK